MSTTSMSTLIIARCHQNPSFLNFLFVFVDDMSDTEASNMSSEEYRLGMIVPAETSAATCRSPHRGLSPRNVQDGQNMMVQELSSENIHQYSVDMVQSVEATPSSGQVLASKLAELCFTDKPAEVAESNYLANFHALLAQPNCFTHQLFDPRPVTAHSFGSPNSVRGSYDHTDSQATTSIYSQSENNIAYGINELGVENARPQNLNWQGFNALQNHSRQVGNCSAAELQGTGMQAFSALSGVPVRESPLHSYQQQFVSDGELLTPDEYPPHLNQSIMSCMDMEDEPNYRTQQDQLSVQKLHDRQFEAQGASPGSELELPVNLDPRRLTKDGQYMDPCVYPSQIHQPHVQCGSMKDGEYHRVDQYSRLISEYLSQPHVDLSFPPRLTELNQKPSRNALAVPRDFLSSLDTTNGYTAFVAKNCERLPNSLFDYNSNTTNGSHSYFESLDSCWKVPDKMDYESWKAWKFPQEHISFDEIEGEVCDLAKDQNGCRFLQTNFLESTRKDVSKVFFETVGRVVELVMDPYGKCFAEKLVEVCDEYQLMHIIYEFTGSPGELVRISCDLHGTCVVKKVIENMKTKKQISKFVSGLTTHIVILMKNFNGSQVALHCLQQLKPEFNKFIFEAAAANCVELARDRHGCCVLLECLKDTERRHQIVCEITSNAIILSQNQYGNYVVQEVLQFEEATKGILDRLKGSYTYLSVQKYSSNVVEKCLKLAGEECRALIIQELVKSPRLYQMMQDPYGNYVIQVAVRLSKGHLHVALVESITPYASLLQTNPYGKKVLSCIYDK